MDKTEDDITLSQEQLGNENYISEEIAKLESMSGVEVFLVIMGIIGLFLFIIPGIICFIIVAVLANSRHSKEVSLRGQLEMIRNSKPETPLAILKKQLAEGKITESVYLKKKNLLEDKEKDKEYLYPKEESGIPFCDRQFWIVIGVLFLVTLLLSLAAYVIK